jgi:hypothetical protein
VEPIAGKLERFLLQREDLVHVKRLSFDFLLQLTADLLSGLASIQISGQLLGSCHSEKSVDNRKVPHFV